MADARISELPSATVPLDGTELMEVVQGGVNKKVAKSDVATGGGGTVTSVSGTASRISSTGGATPIIDIDAAYDTALTSQINAKVADAINDGTTTVAPSQNAVFDALALKQNILVTFRRLSASHTLDATDLSNVNTGQKVIIEMNVGSANNLTIPLNATQAFPIGSVLEISQYGGGQTSLVATGGVTIRASAGVLTIGSQYSTVRLIKVDTNEWYLNNGEPTVLSGTWTPTLTNTTNVAASTAYLCSWSRVANRITFSGRVDLDPTSTGSTVLGISLPVISAFTQAFQAGGTAFSPGVAGHGAAILADATNDRLTLQFVTVDVANQAFYFSGGYEVI